MVPVLRLGEILIRNEVTPDGIATMSAPVE